MQNSNKRTFEIINSKTKIYLVIIAILSISTFSNSLTNLELFHVMFPSVSNIISGNGEFINVFFAAKIKNQWT